MNKKNMLRILGIFAIGFAYGAVYNPMYIRYMFYDAMLEALQCSNTQLGLLNGIASIVGIVISPFGGYLADKYSAKWIIVISVFMNLPITIVAAMFTHIYPVQVAVWISMNLTGGFAFWPAVLKAVRLASPEGKSDSTFGFFEGCCGVGSLVGNFIAIWIFAKYMDPVAGYKAAMISMGVMSAVAAVFTAIAYNQKVILDNQTDPPVDDAGEVIPVEEQNASFLHNVLVIVKNPGTWMVGFVIVGAYGIYLAQTYFNSYFTGVLGAAVVFSAAMSNFRSYGMKILGGPIGGFLASKVFKSASKFDTACLVVCMGLIVYVWNLSPDTPHVLGIATALTLIIAFFCCMAKGQMWATMDQAHIPVEITGTAVVIISYLGFTANEFFVPFMCGHWLDKYPNDLEHAYDNIFMFLLVLAALGAVAGILLVFHDKRMTKKEQAEAAE